ncbi:hypothetical protein HZH66_006499 [Vespula vulgaris]|uniref:Uncharacterized protein n=1 Tax=Vespula vulgaris TaxID=7454 RepID=A0A834K210_VESVU|nr:hypothetical protein HZH66_006499 [Vespula vulgaris]
MSATTSCDIVSFTVQSTRVLGIAECVGSCGYAADRRFYSEPLRKDVTLAEKKAHGKSFCHHKLVPQEASTTSTWPAAASPGGIEPYRRRNIAFSSFTAFPEF